MYHEEQDLGPEDPELLKMSGSTVLEPPQEGVFSGNMLLPEATAVLKTKAILRFGPENYKMIIYCIQGLFVLFCLYILWKIFGLIKDYFDDDPVAKRLIELEREKEQKKQANLREKNKKQNKNSSNVAATTTEGGEEQEPLSSSSQQEETDNSLQKKKQQQQQVHTSNLAPCSNRSRKPTLSKHSSYHNKFDLVSVCATSPDANLLIISERSRRTFSVFPQHKNFISTFKTTLNISEPLLLPRSSDPASKPLVTSVHFSPDCRYLCAFDVGCQSLVVLRNDSSSEGKYTEHEESKDLVRLMYKLRLADFQPNLLPIQKGELWGKQYATFYPVPSPDRIYFFHKEGTLSVYSATSGKRVSTAKKSLGNNVSLGVADSMVASSGSMMCETNLYRLKTRVSASSSGSGSSSSGGGDSSSAVTFERFGPTLSPSSKKLSHVILSPDFSMLMLLAENEDSFKISFFYNTDLDNGEMPKITMELCDSDFLDPKLRSVLHVDLLHFAPDPTYPGKKLAFVTLRIGCDVVVYRIDVFEALSNKAAAPKCGRVLEIHGCHDDPTSSLMGCGVVGRGRGLVTAVESDSRQQLRCWEFDNSGFVHKEK